MKPLRNFVVLIILLICMMTGISNAATLAVSTTGDELNTNGSCSLREAIRNINQGSTTYSDCTPSGAYGTDDTINIPAGTYTITIAGSGEDNNATGDFDIIRRVSIAGAGSATTIIDGGGIDRVFHIPTHTAGVSISGVTIQNGSSNDGGGVYAWGSSNLTLSNCIIINNTTTGNGGGILNNGGTVTLNSCLVTNNTANRAAGGILNNSGSVLLSVNNSTISNNSSSSDNGGGGIFNGATATVTNSTISGNSTSGNSGGGIVNFGPMTVTNSVISENSTTNSGGGIGNYSTLTITDTTISSNTSSSWGGGIQNSSSMTLTNVTISSNTSSSWGGGIQNSGSMYLTNVTISSNQAEWGAGIHTQPGATNSIESCTIANNYNASTYSGAGIAGNGYSEHNVRNTIVSNNTNTISSDNCYQAFVSLGYNISSDGTCYNFNQAGDMLGVDPFLGPLQDNGGPTFTHALLEGSPALDYGNPVNYPETDQRGVNRPQGAGPDIGAFELQTEPMPDLTGEWHEPFTEKCSTKTEGLVCRVKGKLIVTNTGEANAHETKIRFYFSEDDSYGEGDILLQESDKDSILIGKTDKKSYKLTLPVGMSLADGYIIAYIDADNTTTESDESNNFVVYGRRSKNK